MENWKHLEVWRLSHALALRVDEIIRDSPSEKRFRRTDQLYRAAASTLTNIAEGKGSSALKEYLHFLCVAKGSVEEIKYLILLGENIHYIIGIIRGADGWLRSGSEDAKWHNEVFTARLRSRAQ